MLKIVVLLLACLAPCGLSARTITVDDDGPADYSTIAAAIAAATNGDTIVVYPGAYVEAVSFEGLSITVRSIDPNDLTVVASTIITQNTGYSVSFTRSEGPGAVLQGFTITGRGIRCSGSNTKPTIIGNIIRQCADVGISGALNAAPSIIANQISFNAGGGINQCDGLISGNWITGNRATRGAGLYDCDGVIRNNIISGNLALHTTTQGDGSGLYGCDGTVESNTIVGNVARNDGRPDSHGFGGGLYDCRGTVRNNIIAGNIANSGGGIYAPTNKTANSYNNYWQNTPDAFAGAIARGIGELFTDPLFVESGVWDDAGTPTADDDFWIEGDYHIRSVVGRWNPATRLWVQDPVHSLCIDAADPVSDWTAELWRNGRRANLGAYGGTAEASMSVSTLGLLTDFDFDGATDINDLVLLAAKWLTDEAPVAEDVTRDGAVDLFDLALLLQDWESHPPAARPPDPDPMLWAVKPYPTGPYSIRMTAWPATATDGTGVEYWFENFNNPAHNSDWISFAPGQEATWEFTGLTPDRWYYFRVKARNVGNRLETDFSAIAWTKTDVEDLTAPAPNPATWATAPYALSSSSIRMVATTATDENGVEYSFECTSHPGLSSGWQDSPEYVVSGLAKGVYAFRVQYRDKSPNRNAGMASTQAAVDLSPPTPDPMEWAVGGEPKEIKIGSGTFDYYAQMTCVEATDSQDQIQYYFQCVDLLSLSSGWVTSRTYTVKVGRSGQALRFRVKARDQAGNETGWSPILPAM